MTALKERKLEVVSVLVFLLWFLSSWYFNLPPAPPLSVAEVERLSPEVTCSPVLVYHQELVIKNAPDVLISYWTIRDSRDNAWFVDTAPRYAVVEKNMVIDRDVTWVLPELPPPGKYRALVGYQADHSKPAIVAFDFTVPVGCK